MKNNKNLLNNDPHVEIKNKIVNYLSFINFQLDILKTNIVLTLNAIDRVEVNNQFYDNVDLFKKLNELGAEIKKTIDNNLKVEKDDDDKRNNSNIK